MAAFYDCVLDHLIYQSAADKKKWHPYISNIVHGTDTFHLETVDQIDQAFNGDDPYVLRSAIERALMDVSHMIIYQYRDKVTITSEINHHYFLSKDIGGKGHNTAFIKLVNTGCKDYFKWTEQANKHKNYLHKLKTLEHSKELTHLIHDVKYDVIKYFNQGLQKKLDDYRTGKPTGLYLPDDFPDYLSRDWERGVDTVERMLAWFSRNRVAKQKREFLYIDLFAWVTELPVFKHDKEVEEAIKHAKWGDDDDFRKFVVKQLAPYFEQRLKAAEHKAAEHG